MLQAVQPEPPEVVGYRPRGIRVRIASLEPGDVIAEFPMSKAGGCEREETERVHTRVSLPTHLGVIAGAVGLFTVAFFLVARAPGDEDQLASSGG